MPVILFIALLIPLVIFLIARSGGNKMAKAFVKMGVIKGRPVSEIIQIVGPPSSVSASGKNVLYQWMSIKAGRGAHYAILVDIDGNAIGYTHQYAK